MVKPRIPIRPKGRRYKLTEKEMDCLTWHVLSGCKREDAYLIFVRPDLFVSKRNLSTISTQFYASMEVRAYIEAYKNTLEDSHDADAEELDLDKKVEKANRNLNEQIVEKMTGTFDKVEDLAVINKLAKEAGMRNDKEQEQEKPRRYLPETCSACSYRVFVESNIEQGNIENECDRCRTRKFAEEHGWKYDATKNLE